MPQRNRKTRVRYDRIIGVAAVLIVVIVLLVTGVRSCGKDEKDTPTDSKPLSTTAPPEGSSTTDSGAASGTTADGSPTAPAGYSQQSVSNDTVHTGNLIVVNRDHAYTFPAATENIQPIYKTKLSTYQVKDYETYLDTTVITQFNSLMQAFYDKTYNTDIMIIGGYRTKETQESYVSAKKTDIPAGCTEYHTGLSFDLGIFPKTGSTGYYAPKGDFKWIGENMAAYGFIVRYPEGKDAATGEKAKAYQLRYVGVPHASYINDNSLCLEEYVDLLKKDYAFGNKTLSMQIGSSRYEVYYVAAGEGSETQIFVPTGSECTISGNNIDGFIVTAKVS